MIIARVDAAEQLIAVHDRSADAVITVTAAQSIYSLVELLPAFPPLILRENRALRKRRGFHQPGAADANAPDVALPAVICLEKLKRHLC